VYRLDLELSTWAIRWQIWGFASSHAPAPQMSMARDFLAQAGASLAFRYIYISSCVMYVSLTDELKSPLLPFHIAFARSGLLSFIGIATAPGTGTQAPAKRRTLDSWPNACETARFDIPGVG